MYLVGGWSPSGVVDSVFMIDLHEKVPQTWREQKKLAQPLYSSCVINWEGKILITGGGSKQKDSTEEILDMKTVEFYDPIAENEVLPEMNYARRQHGCSSVVFSSGRTGRSFSFKLEIYDLSIGSTETRSIKLNNKIQIF